MKRTIRNLARALLATAVSGLICSSANAQRPFGIDTSGYNGSNAVWSAVYTNGFRFAFTRSSQGTWLHDGTLFTNMFKAKAAGLVIGPYHLAEPTNNTATAEADYFIAWAGRYITNGYLRPVLDLETFFIPPNASTLSTWVNAWCNRVKSVTGVSPIIYCNVDEAQNYLNTTVTNWDLWIAQYYNGCQGCSWTCGSCTTDPQTHTPSTGVWNGRWTFWQYVGDMSSLPGVPSSVDMDVFNGTLAQLQDQIIGGGTNPPSIVQQPSSMTVGSNQVASFTVLVSGGTPFSYQWQKNSANVSNGGHYSGCTTATLTVTNADGNDAANYRCVVTNAYGSATSSQATLTVTANCDPTALTNPSFEGGNTGGVGTGWTGYQRAPLPTTVWSIQTASPQPGTGLQYQQIANTSSTGGSGVRQDITGCTVGATYSIAGWFRGNSASSIVTVEASPTASTNWATATNLYPAQTTSGSTWTSFSGTIVATGTSMTLWLDETTTGTGLNKVGCFDAIGVTCTALPPSPPVVTQQPTSSTNCGGTTANFSVAVSGSTPSYQWQKNDVDQADGGHYSGCTTATLTITGVDSSDAANYRCRISNVAGSTNSSEAALTVWAATTITTQPNGAGISIGGTTNFTVAATGQGTLTYQWQKNSVNMSNGGHYSGVTTTTLTVSNADTNDAANYRCVVTAGCGSVNSFQAALTVGCAPNPLTNPSFEGGNTSGVGTGWTGYQRAPNPGTSWSIQTASPPTGGGLQYQQMANPSSTGGGGVRQDLTGCTSGATYTISGWMRGNSASATCTVKVSPTASTNWSTAINLNPPQSVSGSTWTAFSGSVVASNTSMTIWLDGQTGGTGLNKAECFDVIGVSCAP